MTDGEALSMGVCPDNPNHRVTKYMHPETQEAGFRCDGCDVWFGRIGNGWVRHVDFTKTINDFWRSNKR